MSQPESRFDGVRVVGFDPRWRDDFRTLNEEWLRRYFEIEPLDATVLADPETHILAPGGQVLFALIGERAVGTCALLPIGDEMELTKMAVHPDVRGAGIGRVLLSAAIAAFRESGARQLFLESSSRLGPALALYRSLGFELQPGIRPGSHYARADVYMIWRSPDRAPDGNG